MTVKRIKKHFLIVSRRLNQKAELRRIAKHQNQTLEKVLTSFLTVKYRKIDHEDQSAFEHCENYRSTLFDDKTEVSYDIFGIDKTARVMEICKNAPSSKRWCEFLYFIIKNTSAPICLEIGTNLGVSGSYILEAMKHKEASKFVTMEGLPQLCTISSKQFSSIVPASKFEVKQGLYDKTFPELLKENVNFNILFIDGNHKKKPTLEYFEQLKSNVSSPAIFIFDDINWSDEMKEAWEIIKKDPEVNYTLDLYEQGIVIIDKNESEKNVDFSLHLAY
ncbi:Predicted O-methyltransferase YrrM [Reichenbachiella agariperforans]|uniref:Predicted O-methyltransferase YrrM n=1 Tax=Reichenbachiella agariperforans TaxID=156994 RepID=A0A1M6JLS9_REIAG|nr:Predicted O-methyltransferase YrrM [Reichenbachiella agariperforans]